MGIAIGYGALLALAIFLSLGDGQALNWDNGLYYFPVSVEACRQVRHGVLPALNPYLWSGAPLLAEQPTQALHPVTWLACLLGSEEPSRTMALAYAMHVGIAAAGVVLLGDALAMSIAGSLLAATVYAANPFFAYLGTGFIVELAVFAWLPWMLFCAYRAPLDVERTYGLVLGLELPAGKSHVELRYRPSGFALGLGISVVTALGLAIVAALEARRRPAGPAA